MTGNAEKKTQENEVKANQEVFSKLLPGLLEQNLKGQYALMRSGKIEAVLKDFNDAVIMGNRMFENKLFSVQPIVDEPINLGWYSYK